MTSVEVDQCVRKFTIETYGFVKECSIMPKHREKMSIGVPLLQVFLHHERNTGIVEPRLNDVVKQDLCSDEHRLVVSPVLYT